MGEHRENTKTKAIIQVQPKEADFFKVLCWKISAAS
jgi:hypothetical protein